MSVLSRMPHQIIRGAILLSAFLLLISSSCNEDDPISPNGSSGVEFLVGCKGDGDVLPAGLYKMTNNNSGPQFTFITEFYPWNYDLDGADMNNNRLAITVLDDIVPEGESGVMYMDKDNLTNINWVPIPQAPEDHYYDVKNYRPQVMPNGNIIYGVSLETDNVYDDAHSGMLAIYNPNTGDLELSGPCSPFVLAQPEQGTDTEAGSMTYFVMSPDGQYVYCTVYGYGTDAGVYHTDYSFIVRYTIGSPNSYERIAQMPGQPNAVTADGKYLIVANGPGGGLHKVDLTTVAVEKIDDYNNSFCVGQVSKTTSQMFKIWRGSGMGEWDMSMSPVAFTTVIDGTVMEGSYRGLGHGAQYSSDESKIYFTASTDFHTNYASDLRIFSIACAAKTNPVKRRLEIRHLAAR